MRNFLIDRGEGPVQGPANFGPELHCNFIQALVAVGTAIAAKKSADKQAKRAGKANAAQEKAEDRQATIAENQDRRAQVVFDQYQGEFLPRQRQLLADAFDNNQTSPEAAEARATADMRKAAMNAQEINDRAARRLGVDPSSGSFAAGRRDIEIRNAASEASERGFARREARDSNFGRQMSVLGMGQGLPATAGGLSGSAAGIFGNLGASAARRRELADAASAEAGRAFGGAVASGIGALYGAWQNRNMGGIRTDVPVGGTPPYNPQTGVGTVYG